MSDFAAVVLAGGAARRMGGAAKPLLTVGGVSLLSRVLAAVANARPRIVVGPGELVPLLPRGVSLTIEVPPGGGPVAAAAAGLALLGGTRTPGSTNQVALLAADLPFLSRHNVDSLRRGLADGTDGAVLVDNAGHDQWLCGVWRLESLVAQLAQFGDPVGRSMKELAGGLRVAQVAAPDPSRPPAWFDCDTEDDLRRAEEWADGDVG